MAHHGEPKAKKTIGRAGHESTSGLMALFGLIEPEKEKWGAKLGSVIPPEFKTDGVKRILGLLKGWAQGQHLHGLPGALTDLGVDVLDFAFEGGKNPHEAAVKAETWTDAFMKDAQKRLKEAPADQKVAVMSQVREEFGLYKAFYAEAMGIQEDHGAPTPEHSPVDWNGLDNWLGRTAQTIQRQFPSTRPKSLLSRATVGASGLPDLGDLYGRKPGESGGTALASTLGRGANSVHRGFNAGIRMTIVILGAIFGLIVLSLWWGWSSGLLIGIITLVCLPIIVYFLWPTISTIVLGVSWRKWTPSGSRFWPFMARVLAGMLFFVTLFMWWPIIGPRFWPEEGATPSDVTGDLVRKTIVLLVIALALFWTTRTSSSGGHADHDHGHSHGGGKGFRTLFIVLLILGLIWFFCWKTEASTEQPPRPTTSAWTQPVTSGEVSALTMLGDTVMILAPNMKEGACIYQISGASHFWTSDPSDEFWSAANCNGKWRKEGPGRNIGDGQLLGSIGLWNKSDHTVTVVIHSRR